MNKEMYFWIGGSSFPGQEQGSRICIVQLAEMQPDGTYRACTRRGRDGSTKVGFVVDPAIYDQIMQRKFQRAEFVEPVFGPNNRLLDVRKQQ